MSLYSSQPVLVPPLEEQHQIVAILEHAEELRQLRAEADRLTDEILPSTFIEMFGDPRENPKGWKTIKLGDAHYFRRHGGGTPNRSVLEYWVDGTIPWLTNTEVQKGRIESITDTKESMTEAGLASSSATMIPRGSVMLTCTASIGKVALAGVELTTNQQFNSFECNLSKVEPAFLAYFLSTQKGELESLAGQTTFRHLTIPNLSKLDIPLPPLEQQQRFGDLVKELQVNQQRQAEARQILDSLYQSLSTQAFTGELTALWREEQKALKAERQAVILALLFRLAQQNRGLVLITTLMKYLFLLQVEGRAKGLYHFIPYKYGPFARQVYDDLNVLKERGLITVSAAATDAEKERTEISLRSDHGKEMEQLVQNLPEDVQEDAEGIIDLYGELSVKELLDYVYAEYPDYAIRSER